MRVLHLTTHNEACGIGKYRESFSLGIATRGHDVEDIVFDVSPNVLRTLPQDQFDAAIARFIELAKTADLVHIQHEFGFYSRDELLRVVDGSHGVGRRVVITMHTSPRLLRSLYERPARGGFGPRAILNWRRALAGWQDNDRRVVEPLRRADLLIVHNDGARQGLLDLGVDASRIVRMVLPVRDPGDVVPSRSIRDAFDAKPGDVIVCTVGFLHRFKGVDAAIKALRYLPEHIKLAVIGGMNPSSDDTGLYDDLADLVRDLGVMDRVQFVGYVDDDHEMDRLVRGCDVAVYPYEPSYYNEVSSAAINVALSNGMPTIGYPTNTFRELAAITPSLTLTASPNYIELARAIADIVPTWPNQPALDYTSEYSYEERSAGLVAAYQRVLS